MERRHAGVTLGKRQQENGQYLLEKILEDSRIELDETLRRLARTNFAQANDAAAAIYDFAFLPAFRERHPLWRKDRQIIAVSHNADGDGASGDAVEHGMAALGAICSPEISKYVHWSFERVMRLSSEPNDPESVQQIVARTRNRPTLYLFSDVGSSELDAIKAHTRRAIVMDHHPLRGTPGKQVLVVNPYRQGLEGNQLSGGEETFIVFHYLMWTALRNNPFRLDQGKKKQVKILERSLLLTALGGANADQIGSDGMNQVLYRYAENLGLLTRCEIGGFGHSTKDVAKMVAQTLPFVNCKYPVNRLKQFRRALAGSITNGRNLSLSPQAQEIADRLYDTYRGVFMLQFKRPEAGHYSGLNDRRLFFNMQNIQFLDDEELADINGALNRLGITESPLSRIEEWDDEGKKDRVVISPDSSVHPSEFYHYSDDFRGNMAKREEIITQRLPVMVDELLNEMRNRENTFPLIKSLAPPKGKKSVYERKPRAADFTEGELEVIKRLCSEIVVQYGDPFQQQEYLDAIQGPNFIIKERRSDVPLAYWGKTVAEVGNLLTAMSKLRQREALLQALPWTRAPKEERVQILEHIHKIYRRIIAFSSSRFESLVERIAQPIGEGIYYVPLEQVMAAKYKVATMCEREHDYAGADLARNLPDAAMNGVILGVGIEAGLFPEIYAMVFGSVPISLEGKAAKKTSVRVHRFAGEKYQGHMGNILYRVTRRGGGHATAASMRYWSQEEPEILEEITRRVAVYDHEEHELQRRVPADRLPKGLGGNDA